ncbi:hypothetical protein C8J57DRAFT_1649051 [Mycena rebaudengoi]|nr:hypothetical protein C8J57DRAFT_1649051 [Mycena rebaudengoi]
MPTPPFFCACASATTPVPRVCVALRLVFSSPTPVFPIHSTLTTPSPPSVAASYMKTRRPARREGREGYGNSARPTRGRIAAHRTRRDVVPRGRRVVCTPRSSRGCSLGAWAWACRVRTKEKDVHIPLPILPSGTVSPSRGDRCIELGAYMLMHDALPALFKACAPLCASPLARSPTSSFMWPWCEAGMGRGRVQRVQDAVFAIGMNAMGCSADVESGRGGGGHHHAPRYKRRNSQPPVSARNRSAPRGARAMFVLLSRPRLCGEFWDEVEGQVLTQEDYTVSFKIEERADIPLSLGNSTDSIECFHLHIQELRRENNRRETSLRAGNIVEIGFLIVAFKGNRDNNGLFCLVMNSLVFWMDARVAEKMVAMSTQMGRIKPVDSTKWRQVSTDGTDRRTKTVIRSQFFTL